MISISIFRILALVDSIVLLALTSREYVLVSSNNAEHTPATNLVRVCGGDEFWKIDIKAFTSRWSSITVSVVEMRPEQHQQFRLNNLLHVHSMFGSNANGVLFFMKTLLTFIHEFIRNVCPDMSFHNELLLRSTIQAVKGGEDKKYADKRKAKLSLSFDRQ
uniref:Secreted protein n=1 Tax=Caenorhabditis japonica TaxID=281687 RepID=A0A8R1ITX9_CAEJA